MRSCDGRCEMSGQRMELRQGGAYLFSDLFLLAHPNQHTQPPIHQRAYPATFYHPSLLLSPQPPTSPLMISTVMSQPSHTSISSHPTPSHPIPSHPYPYPIPSHPTPSHPRSTAPSEVRCPGANYPPACRAGAVCIRVAVRCTLGIVRCQYVTTALAASIGRTGRCLPFNHWHCAALASTPYRWLACPPSYGRVWSKTS